MDKETTDCRTNVLEAVATLASPAAQLQYEHDVPIADVPAELVCFGTDFYNPKYKPFVDAFTNDELRSLAELYGRVCIASEVINKKSCHSVAELQKIKEWRSVITFSKQLEVELKNG